MCGLVVVLEIFRVLRSALGHVSYISVKDYVVHRTTSKMFETPMICELA